MPEVVVTLKCVKCGRDFLKIPDTQMQYVVGAPSGSGLMYFGANGCIPFKDEFPTDTKLYKLMTTKFGEE